MVVALVLATLAACSLAPPYQPPRYAMPAEWRGEHPFGVANPSDTLPRGPWWEQFGDPRLNGLEQQLEAQNPTLAAMYEQYVQARDAAAIARSALYPQVSSQGLLSSNEESENSLFKNPQITQFSRQVDARAAALASWQPDFWQQIRNQERQQARLAQSSAALVANARLSLQVQLASTYIALRGLDAQAVIFRNSVAYYETSLGITQLRLRGKIGTLLDVRRAEAQLASTQALESANLANRSVLEHAIAVLVGADASTFTIPPEPDSGLSNPAVPVGVPAQLLERRPDIASAERQMAAANAGIGIARAAFFPNITISATGGFENTGLANLLTLPNSLWSIGASAVLPLFQGGLRRAELQSSWAQFALTRDNYRATVLTAFQQVEDGLSLSRSLQSQTVSQQQAVTAANGAVTLTQQLYIGGLITYLEVVIAEQTALTTAVASVQAWTLQLQTTVNLIGALGGGWTAENLPSEKDVLPFNPVNVLNHDRSPRPDGTGEGGSESSRPPR
jgi:NodT family efflux transporter outer membrane factor (OMF) lipoprotein